MESLGLFTKFLKSDNLLRLGYKKLFHESLDNISLTLK